MSKPDAFPSEPTALPKNFRDAWMLRATVIRAIKVAAVVGTLLTAINQGDVILMGESLSIWKVGLTYLVPYSVSSYSSAMFIVDLSRSINGIPDSEVAS